MRGRLINGFVVEIAQLDTQATAARGYDPIFKEPVVSYDASGVRDGGRREKTTRTIAQIETGTFNQMRMTAEGNAPKAQMTLVFHFEELERAGLVDVNHRPTINVNDRLVRILDKGGNVLQEFPNPPGLYIVELTPSGFGFGGSVNLLVARLGDRAQAKTA